MSTTQPQPVERITDKMVLLFIAIGLVSILLGIIVGLFLTPRALPNWAENVLVSIATVAGLKLGDCLSTLVALVNGRQVGEMGTKLANSAPVAPRPVPTPAPAPGLNDEERPAGTERDPVHTTTDDIEGKPNA